MHKLLMFSSLFALAVIGGGCHKDRAVPTVPSSALPETTEEKEVATPSLETEELAIPSAHLHAGQTSLPAARETVLVDPGAAEPMPVEQVVAVLAPTKGSKVAGTIRFRDSGDGLEVTADVTGLPAGPHAYHVHVFGDCSGPDAESAGEHFHFHGSSLAPTEAIVTGDLGELTGDATGKATRTDKVTGATLQGKFSIVGRSVVVHEKGNDPTHPPDGAAGKRLACGVIGVASEPITPEE